MGAMILELRRCWAATAVTLVVAATPLDAAAQTGPATPPAPAAPEDPVAQASAHYARGVKLYQEDDFRAALIEFNRAYELAPNWAVLFNLGQARYQLREYPGALKTLERYLREGGPGIDAERRAQVEREIGELRGRVARITPVTSVEGADLTLDDAPVGKLPASEPLVVGAGRHRLTASKPGYVATAKVVDIAGGDELTIRLDLAPEAPAPPAARESANYTVAVVAGGVALSGIAVGTVFGVLAMNDKASLKSECRDDKVCPPSAQGDIDGFARNGAVSTVGFGVGVAGLIVGGYFFFHERGKDTTPPGAPRASLRGTTITPWLGPGAGGVAGTF